MTLVCLIAAYLNNFDIYNFQSGGKVKSLGVKKFKRDETNPAKIVEAFLSRNFEEICRQQHDGQPGRQAQLTLASRRKK